MSRLLALVLAAACFQSDPAPNDGRFSASALAKPHDGYTDSVFVNAKGDRIYFTHSYLTPGDFIGVTTGSPHGEIYDGQMSTTGVEWNTDLYYVQRDPATGRWSDPINLNQGQVADGSGNASINSFGNECCAWVSDDETEIIFYSDNLSLSGVRATGNYRAVRANRDAPWGTPAPLPGVYGTQSQSATLYRHDIQKTPSGDLYLWERDTVANTSTLKYGQFSGNTWLAPVSIAGFSTSAVYKLSTQPWVSHDEKTLLFNARDATGATSLWRSTRTGLGAAWGTPTQLPLSGFSDPAGKTIWGEPSFGRSENFALYVQFDTSQTGWKSNIMFLQTEPSGAYRSPVQVSQ